MLHAGDALGPLSAGFSSGHAGHRCAGAGDGVESPDRPARAARLRRGVSLRSHAARANLMRAASRWRATLPCMLRSLPSPTVLRLYAALLDLHRDPAHFIGAQPERRSRCCRDRSAAQRHQQASCTDSSTMCAARLFARLAARPERSHRNFARSVRHIVSTLTSSQSLRIRMLRPIRFASRGVGARAMRICWCWWRRP